MGITTAGDRLGGQELAQLQIHTFYLINGMIPVGGGPFGANLGANFWSQDTLEGVKADAEGHAQLKEDCETVCRVYRALQESLYNEKTVKKHE